MYMYQKSAQAQRQQVISRKLVKVIGWRWNQLKGSKSSLGHLDFLAGQVSLKQIIL